MKIGMGILHRSLNENILLVAPNLRIVVLFKMATILLKTPYDVMFVI